MQHVVHALHRACGECHIGEIAFGELHARKMREILTFAGRQVVGDADRVAAAHQLLRKMRPDEASAARHQVGRHSVEVDCKS